MRTLVSVAPVIPGVSHLKRVIDAPWPLAPNLIEQEPQLDSCDGRAGTWGWDNPFVSADITWPGPESSLAATLDSRLSTLGFTPAAADASAPNWTSSWGDWNWTRLAPDQPKIAVELSADDSQTFRGQPLYNIEIEAPPVGRIPSGC
jgi:hypothetical protein